MPVLQIPKVPRPRHGPGWYDFPTRKDDVAKFLFDKFSVTLGVKGSWYHNAGIANSKSEFHLPWSWRVRDFLARKGDIALNAYKG